MSPALDYNVDDAQWLAIASRIEEWPNGCCFFSGRRSLGNNQVVRVNGRPLSLRRLVWLRSGGAPNVDVVRMACGVTRCVNYDHMIASTRSASVAARHKVSRRLDNLR